MYGAAGGMNFGHRGVRIGELRGGDEGRVRVWAEAFVLDAEELMCNFVLEFANFKVTEQAVIAFLYYVMND